MVELKQGFLCGGYQEPLFWRHNVRDQGDDEARTAVGETGTASPQPVGDETRTEVTAELGEELSSYFKGDIAVGIEEPAVPPETVFSGYVEPTVVLVELRAREGRGPSLSKVEVFSFPRKQVVHHITVRMDHDGEPLVKTSPRRSSRWILTRVFVAALFVAPFFVLPSLWGGGAAFPLGGLLAVVGSLVGLLILLFYADDLSPAERSRLYMKFAEMIRGLLGGKASQPDGAPPQTPEE